VLQNAQKMGQDISDIFTDKNGARQKAAEDLGKTLGKAFVDGMQGAISAELRLASSTYGGSLITGGPGAVLGQLIGQALSPEVLSHALGPFAGLLGLAGHAEGGIFSRQHLAWISEGNKTEAVVPVADSPRALAIMKAAGLDQMVLRQSGVGGAAAQPGVVFQTTFNGPVADELVAARVTTRMQREARRKGLLIAAGIS